MAALRKGGLEKVGIRRWIGVVVAAATLTYFFEPVNGRARRERARLWIAHLLERARGAGDASPEERHEAAEAAARLEEAMAAAEAVAPPPEAAPFLPHEPENEVPESAAARQPGISVSEVPPPPAARLREWDLPAAPPPLAGEDGGARPSRRILAAAGVAAATSVAVAVGLVLWAVWPTRAESRPAQTQALVENQAEAIALLSQPKVRRVPVLGTKGRLVLVFAPNGNAVLVASQVKQAPSGKTYEAWVIVGNKPFPAGLFGGGASSTVVPLSRPVPKGSTVAVTLEPAEGAASPTSKPLFATKRA